MGETFIIGSGEKGDIAEVLKCLNGGKGFLRKSASPMSRDEILEACSIDTLSDADSDLEKLIDNITHCDRIFESVGDSSFLLRNDRLFTIAQKISRYVYQHGPVSTDGIRTGCKEEYGLELGTIDSSTLKPFGVNFKGAFWEYGNEGNAGMPLRTATKEIATEKVNFTFNDVIDELSRRYHKSDFNELSIRAYITDICNVDNKDPQHFCLKEKTGDYPETSWRQSSRMDLINWILNQVKNALEKGKCKFSEVERYVLSKSSELSDNTHIQARFRWVMKLYSGEGKPFIVIDDTIVRNGATYDATDFDIIGKKGGKLPFHKQIRAIIANELKTVKKIPLVACVGIVNDIMSSAFSRSDILRALQNNELGVATFDVANEGSGVFVIRTDVGEKIVEAKSEPRTPDIIDFIKSLLQREYVILFRQLETDANSAAEKFITYITSSKNSNISSRLYKNIQEFSQADIDEDDAYVYLTNLCLFFEGLLSEIYRTTAPGHTVKGLMAIANRFEYLRDIPTIYPARRNRIESAYISLRDNRNKIAHGEPVEVSKEDAMKLIQDYIVLYAYIVAKYASIR